jgi:L-lactate utilization protein LutB
MNQLKTWHHELLGKKAVTALEKNNFHAVFCKTPEEAVPQILELIPRNAAVGFGGSMTIHGMGLVEKLAERGNPILDHNQPGLDAAQKGAIRRQELTSDVFLTSTNALTLDGKLINTDGAGNRVAAMIFGPGKVIVVAGINKIVKDVAAAEARIKACAAPLNNKRLETKNPCVQTGECMDCQGSGRICNVTTILNKRPTLTDIHVFVIGAELGF